MQTDPEFSFENIRKRYLFFLFAETSLILISMETDLDNVKT